MSNHQEKNTFKFKYHDGAKLQDPQDVMHLELGGCTKIKGVNGSLIEAAKQANNVVFYSFDQKYELVDFVYCKEHSIYAFQVTVGVTHSCNASKLEKVIEETGPDYEFLLHYLTYDTKFELFTTEPANPFTGSKIPVKSSITSSWTIKVICVPSPEGCIDTLKINATTNVESMNVKQLKNELKKKNLSVSGNKATLIERLMRENKQMDR
jgi:hypothetical protein